MFSKIKRMLYRLFRDDDRYVTHRTPDEVIKRKLKTVVEEYEQHGGDGYQDVHRVDEDTTEPLFRIVDDDGFVYNKGRDKKPFTYK